MKKFRQRMRAYFFSFAEEDFLSLRYIGRCTVLSFLFIIFVILISLFFKEFQSNFFIKGDVVDVVGVASIGFLFGNPMRFHPFNAMLLWRLIRFFVALFLLLLALEIAFDLIIGAAYSLSKTIIHALFWVAAVGIAMIRAAIFPHWFQNNSNRMGAL